MFSLSCLETVFYETGKVNVSPLKTCQEHRKVQTVLMRHVWGVVFVSNKNIMNLQDMWRIVSIWSGASVGTDTMDTWIDPPTSALWFVRLTFSTHKGFVRLALTCRVAAAGRAALSRPLQVEAILAALAVAAFRVSLTVDAVQTQRVVQAVLRSPIALTTHYRCMRK